MGVPGLSGDVGGAAVEEVLAIVEVEDGEPTVVFLEVLRGQVNGDGAIVGKDIGVEGVSADLGLVSSGSGVGGWGSLCGEVTGEVVSGGGDSGWSGDGVIGCNAITTAPV